MSCPSTPSVETIIVASFPYPAFPSLHTQPSREDIDKLQRLQHINQPEVGECMVIWVWFSHRHGMHCMQPYHNIPLINTPANGDTTRDASASSKILQFTSSKTENRSIFTSMHPLHIQQTSHAMQPPAAVK